MTKEALKLALEAFDSMIGRKPERVEQAITAIKEALAQPEQEPVAWIDKMVIDVPNQLFYRAPQRTWVGLTDEDLEAEFGFIDELLRDTCYRTEAKLKSKNF